MYGRILIPTDGSQEIDAVAEHAVGLAEGFDAELHVLSVVDETAYASIPQDARDQIRDGLEADGSDATKSVAERAVERGIDVTRELRWGNPPAAILVYGEENDIDLVVMGTHGRTGYERYLLGSVAEKVVRASRRPVMTVYVGDGEDENDDIVTLG